VSRAGAPPQGSRYAIPPHRPLDFLELGTEGGEASRDVERRLGSEGRLLLRYSGTEPLVRIMIEGPGRDEIEALADDLAVVLLAELS